MTQGLASRVCGHKEVLKATVVLLLLISHQCLAAPQVSASQRADAELGEKSPSLTMTNPFGSGEEERRLLKMYINSNLKEVQGSPDHMTWEQEIFYLFSLHDYDKSGEMDGLELMKLLSDFISHQSLTQQSSESVISMVDVLLQTQDLNQDGMLNPTELLSPPIEHRSAPADQQPNQVEADTAAHAPPEQGTQPASLLQSEESVPQTGQLQDSKAPEPPGSHSAEQHSLEIQDQQIRETGEEREEQFKEPPGHQEEPEM
ncbi:cell growth regulator with EF hand domain protein 1 [Lepisosteus oculatus]|uniref:cell growth regulator with EF hand domain protein 1 n=1 Tax=Lepisosteus oculatus TaxID=7918 RepID=UPI0035F50583